LIEWKSVPPIAPRAKAPPQSSTIRQGLMKEKENYVELFSFYSPNQGSRYIYLI
jgi:hypothetical protein